MQLKKDLQKVIKQLKMPVKYDYMQCHNFFKLYFVFHINDV